MRRVVATGSVRVVEMSSGQYRFTILRPQAFSCPRRVAVDLSKDELLALVLRLNKEFPDEKTK